jgi:hypothetical protein
VNLHKRLSQDTLYPTCLVFKDGADFRKTRGSGRTNEDREVISERRRKIHKGSCMLSERNASIWLEYRGGVGTQGEIPSEWVNCAELCDPWDTDSMSIQTTTGELLATK